MGFLGDATVLSSGGHTAATAATALSRSRCPDGQTRMCSSGDGFSWVTRRGGEEFRQEMITCVVFGLLILNAPACRFGGFRASQTHPFLRGHRHPRRSSDSVAG